MPSVNLRLTDEQHAELVEAGKRENRSLQREMIYRLFGRFNETARTGAGDSGVDRSGTKSPRVEPPAPVQADSQPRDVPARTIVPPAVDDHFRPDPKPERKKK